MTNRERRGWAVVGALFTTLFFVWGAINSGGVFVIPVLKYFGWTRARISMLAAVSALAGGAAGPMVGWLLDRIDARKVMVAGAGLYALGLLILSRANSFGDFFVIYIVFGISSAASTILPSSVVIANWFEERRGLAMSIAFTAISLGGAAMTIVANYAIKLGGWRLGCVALAVPIAVIVLPLVMAIVRTRPATESAAQAPVAAGEPAPAFELPGLEMRHAFRTRSLWMLALAFLLANCIGSGVGFHFIAYLMGIGYSATFAAGMASLSLLFVALGSLLAGPLADRLGARTALAVAYGAWSIGMVLLMDARHSPALFAYVVLGGFLFGAPWVLGTLAVVESMGIRRLGSVLGFLGLFSTIGMAIGPVVTGRIFDVTHSYHLAFLAFIALSVLSAAAVFACLPLEREQERFAAPTASAAA